jgi:cytochrome c553
MNNKILFFLMALGASHGAQAADIVADLLQTYQAEGAGSFDATQGAARWVQEASPADGGAARSCATCHGADLTQAGRQANTGKTIAPMALSVEASRLQDPVKIEKWFGRNCQWTWGRLCTPQEKGDFLSFIQQQ